MRRIKFYSEYDMACGHEIEKIIEKINKNAIDTNWTISDLIEFHNIIKYIDIECFADYIIQKTGVDIKGFKKKIKEKIGRFIGVNKRCFIDLYEYIELMEVKDFFEIVENYSIYREFSDDDFRNLLNKKYINISLILKFKKITEYFDCILKEEVLNNSKNAETIIAKYLDDKNLFLPPSLTENEILSLIDEYIDSPQVNINVLRKIIFFPTNKGINIPDKIKLHAKRKEKEEELKFFSSGTGIESGVSISYPIDQDEVVILNMDEQIVDIKVSRKWLENNLDFATLWNNFIYVFNFVDDKFRLVFSSKTNEMSALESVFRLTGKHLYNKSFIFEFKEMISNTEIYSYIKVLSIFSIRLEDMIEWFFHEYLNEEFLVKDFIVKMPSEDSSYFEKCRTILPEIDRIFKQFNVLIEENEIDQELIQMSSSSVKNSDIKSFNDKKYVYPLNGWYQTVSFLIFSDQSELSYINEKYEKNKNFLEMIINENISISDFQEYQLPKVKWLIDNDLILENEDGYIKFTDIKLIYILKELYYEDVLSYWHYPYEVREVIDNLASKNYVCFESTLLSRSEQDYLDYYLNKSKFTNGHDIRNRYLHGTNSNDENQYEVDYYSILKLIVIIIIKINDDLCIKKDYGRAPENC
ncbi:hypothetical protein CYK71_09245 [Clostridium perfringens]|uniref:hypothetical protein n=1 Tax=Clostridium perfringens TaxID=1502 RepID=UPI000D711811|nr:hypothetical protein [Clostridium perfringens]PWX01571.1 hypothetical protein CYK71_09245 [Clostridium perfringens]HAT4320891.1 hypothetical protein [Clostridium perfringens]HAT4329843.1 hypothetical protein [Clostridium perfringens]